MVLLGFIKFYRVLPSFIELYRVEKIVDVRLRLMRRLFHIRSRRFGRFGRLWLAGPKWLYRVSVSIDFDRITSTFWPRNSLTELNGADLSSAHFQRCDWSTRFVDRYGALFEKQNRNTKTKQKQRKTGEKKKKQKTKSYKAAASLEKERNKKKTPPGQNRSQTNAEL